MDTCTCSKYAPVSRQTHSRIALTVCADPCRTYGSCLQNVQAIAVLITVALWIKVVMKSKAVDSSIFWILRMNRAPLPSARSSPRLSYTYLRHNQPAGISHGPVWGHFFFAVFWQEKHRNGLPARNCLPASLWNVCFGKRTAENKPI